jgi:hypothetical protein
MRTSLAASPVAPASFACAGSAAPPDSLNAAIAGGQRTRIVIRAPRVERLP